METGFVKNNKHVSRSRAVSNGISEVINVVFV